MHHCINCIPLPIILQVYCKAAIIVEVRLNSYSNPFSRDCDGDSCDPVGDCDNIFEFCLRSAGTSFCLTNTITTDDISEDSISFTPSQLSDLGISNPLSFPDITTSVSILHMTMQVNAKMICV